MSNDAAQQSRDESMVPPRFTLTVQMDGRPGSVRLAQAVREAARGGIGPDVISLLPGATAEPGAQSAALRCRGTLVALEDAVGCIIGQAMVTLPAEGEVAQLHRQIAQAEGTLSGRDAWRARAVHSAVASTAAASTAAASTAAASTAAASTDAQSVLRAGAPGPSEKLTAGEAAATEALLELRSRVARLEGALAGQLMARLDDRLSHMATREDVEEVAAGVMAALSNMTALVEQQGHDTRHQRDDQQTWQTTMAEEVRNYRHQVEVLTEDNQELKAQLAQRRWWQVWQAWKM